MSRNFDDVTFKNKGKRETITLGMSSPIRTKFDGRNAAHTATADVTERTLTIEATVGDNNYRQEIADVDLENEIIVTRGNGHIKVKVKKIGHFSMEKKYEDQLKH